MGELLNRMTRWKLELPGKCVPKPELGNKKVAHRVSVIFPSRFGIEGHPGKSNERALGVHHRMPMVQELPLRTAF